MDHQVGYEEKMDTIFQEWEEKISSLKDRLTYLKPEKKEAYEQQLKEIQAQREAALQNLGALKKEQGEAWDQKKTELDKNWDGMKVAYETAIKLFK